MKRGLIFSKYDTLAASTRQRFVQALPYLEAAGITAEIQPLFDNRYLAELFENGTRNRGAVVGGYAQRLWKLLRSNDYDFIWVHCELFPYLPLEWLIRLVRKPVIFDYDDAIFHQYDAHKNLLVRTLLGTKLAPLLRRADIAFCGNAYLRDYAASYGARTEIVPTTVDVEAYQPRIDAASHTAPVVGWIGSPSTWNYCTEIAASLKSFVNAQTISVLVVGAHHAADTSLPFTYRHWSEAREIEDIREMDIGIMPIPDAPWARGKCGYKLIQYMACGLPVIASPVGVNCEIVQHGVNGFLASTPEEWRAAITQLVAQPELRKRMGEAGRQRVVEHYSIQHYGPKMAEWIHRLG